MAADFVINTDQKVVFSYGWGTLTLADIINHRTRLLQDARYCAEFRQIMNLADVDEIALSNSEINVLARQRVFATESRRALVVRSAIQYGLSRVFQGYAGAQNISIFHELKEAVAWVGVPIEIANKAFSELRAAHGLA